MSAQDNKRVHIRRWPAALRHVRDARTFAAECVDSWDAVVIDDDLRVVTSELVTNAVVHASTPFTLAVAWNGDLVMVQVTDGSQDLPVLGGELNGQHRSNGQGSRGESCGRGLLLVDAMSLNWGSTRVNGGKTVWAVLKGEPSGAASRQGPMRGS